MFTHCVPTDFTIAKRRQDFSDALTQLDSLITQGALVAYPLIDGKEQKCARVESCMDPSACNIKLGSVVYAGLEEVSRAIKSLSNGASTWEKTPTEKRAQVLERTADIMEQRRDSLCALMIREAGKPWKEADADLVEAIDFCRYYAALARTLCVVRKTEEVPGEDCVYFYQPRGLAVVISPWNFPLAIACGMTVAALVTGNVTIFKPAEQTSLIGYQFAKILIEAGLPPSAFAFLPGQGEEIGRALVDAPETALICFTGSKTVGLEILSKASHIPSGQRHIKKVIAELGGKNAIIVDEDADIDEAIKGVIYSAFGYAGQKCSACSRVICVGESYEPFISRLCAAAADLICGEAKKPGTLVGPVIDEASQKRIAGVISEAQRTLKLAYKGNAPQGGWYVAPTIFRDVDPKSTLWREEVFGPVLACAQVENLSQAIALANDSDYALTGGIFSRSPASIARARQEFKVGNLYINRGCTGAIVQRHPFGGFKLSGVGSKAGGPDYLLQFVEPRAISENTMRRGFTPQA